jgi:hypothetical protein
MSSGQCRTKFIDAGSQIVVVGRWVGRGKGSGVEVQQPTVHVFGLRDAKIERVEIFGTRSEALEAVGLRG